MACLVIGDIHGCFDELQDLLDQAGLTGSDEIIAAGDIVDRGPETPRVLDFFHCHPGARSIMGNHERKHVRSSRGLTRPALSQTITRSQLGEERYAEELAWMEELPRFLELPEAILVHAFFEPGVPLREQRENVIVGTMTGERYLRERLDRPWYELYDGEKPIVVGHRDYLRNGQPLVHRDRVFGLDTGCCTGGSLTGLVLPSFRFVSVCSRGNHWKQTRERFAQVRLQSAPDSALTWEDIDLLIATLDLDTSLACESAQRLDRLRVLRAQAEEALVALHDRVQRENELVLAALRLEGPFDALPASGQGSAYSARIGKSALASLLHQARKGTLTLDSLRRQFRRPAALLREVRPNVE